MDIENGQPLQTNKSITIQDFLSKIMQPAIIVALLSGTYYLSGYWYANGLFGRLGLTSSAIDLPANYYLVESLKPVIAIALPMATLLYWGLETRYLYSPWIKNLILVALGIASTLAGVERLPDILAYVCFALSVMAIVFYIDVSRSGIMIIPFTLRLSVVFQALGIFILFCSLMIFSNSLGRVSAVNALEKRGNNIFIVEFKWKQSPPVELQGKELNLILNSGGKYFVTPFENPAPKSPTLYIIN